MTIEQTLTRDEQAAGLDAGQLRELIGLVDYDAQGDPFPVIGWDAVVWAVGNATQTALVFQTAFTIKEFDMIYSIERGGPGTATETAVMQIERMAFRGFDVGLASAESILMLIVSILLARIYIRAFYREID